MKDKYLIINWFDGEGGDGGGGDGSGIAGAVTTESAQTGTQDRQKAFDDYIKANGDLYRQRFESELNRRMKNVNAERDQLRTQNESYRGITDALAIKYGKSSDDFDGIRAAVDNDRAALEEQAAEQGLTVDQLLHYRQIESENARYKQQMEQANSEREKADVLNRWNNEAEQLKTVYPGFDLEAEAQNPQFASLLGNGVDMKTAFEVIHHDELMTNAMQYAVNRTEKRVTDSIKANGLRAPEGFGNIATAGKIGVDDINRMTKDQINELAQRAMRGERVIL